MRGKIVLFKRYNGGSVGNPWDDGDMQIQDDWELDIDILSSIDGKKISLGFCRFK